MARARRAAAAKAAAAELNPQAKALNWRGLSLELPAELPGTLWFDFQEIDEEGTGELRILKEMLGDEQTKQVRDVIAREKVPLVQVQAVIRDLFNDIFVEYGLADAGESSASDGS